MDFEWLKLALLNSKLQYSDGDALFEVLKYLGIKVDKRSDFYYITKDGVAEPVTVNVFANLKVSEYSAKNIIDTVTQYNLLVKFDPGEILVEVTKCGTRLPFVAIRKSNDSFIFGYGKFVSTSDQVSLVNYVHKKCDKPTQEEIESIVSILESTGKRVKFVDGNVDLFTLRLEKHLYYFVVPDFIKGGYAIHSKYDEFSDFDDLNYKNGNFFISEAEAKAKIS